MEFPLQIYLVGMEAFCPFMNLKQSSNQLEPQAPPPHKTFVPQSQALGFWKNIGSPSWPCAHLICLP